MNHKITFKDWVYGLDKMCQNSFGMGFHDMPDLTYVIDLYEDDCSIKEAYECCCEAWAEDDSLFAAVIGY